MQPVSGKIWLSHAWLLIRRHLRRTFFQLLPLCISGVVFGKAYLLYQQPETPAYATIYLILAIVLAILMAFVICFRETSLELPSFYWLYVAGFNKKYIVLICVLKWGLQYLVSIAVGSLVLSLLQEQPGSIVHMGKVVLPIAGVHVMFLVSVLLSVQHYLTYTWKNK